MKKGSDPGRSISISGRVWRIIVTVLGSIFLFCIITYLVTPLFMVHPNTYEEAAAVLAGYINVDDAADDEANAAADLTVSYGLPCGTVLNKITVYGKNELSGYLLDDPDSDRLLIFFYGIDDDAASGMLYFLENAGEGGAYAGLDIAVVDWPSYGDSKGWCTADSMRQAACDVVSAFTAAAKSEIIVMGFSLGTGPATYAASVCDIDDLILVAPYNEATDLYNQVTPIFYGPLKGLAGFEMKTYKYATGVSVSPLIIASEDDERVTYKSTLKLTEYFPEGFDLETFSGLSHGQLLSAPDVLVTIRNRLNTGN